MTTEPLTEQQVAQDWLVLNLENVALSDEQFVELCADNPDLDLELTAQKELVIMSPPGMRTGRQNVIICGELHVWAKQDGTGVAFSPALFALPNGARRAPDAAWVKRELYEAVNKEELFPVFCPDFVVELMSPSDRSKIRFRMLQKKMQEYMDSGVKLGWVIDPFKRQVHICRPGEPVEVLDNPTTVSGDPLLPGFVLNIAEVWSE